MAAVNSNGHDSREESSRELLRISVMRLYMNSRASKTYRADFSCMHGLVVLLKISNYFIIAAQFAQTDTLFAWLISHQPAVLFSQNKPTTSNQPIVLFSHNKSTPAISHQPNEQAVKGNVWFR
jgi:hypothetical protein